MQMPGTNGETHESSLRGFFGYFLRSYRVTFLLIIGLAVLGVSTLLGLPRETAPEIKVPVAVVVTAYPGAAARDVEELVTEPVEDRLETLTGVKQINSASRLGISTITIEFSADEDLNESFRTLREEVDSVSGLPSAAEDPEVIEISFANDPIVSVGVGGIPDKRLLTVFSERLRDDIEAIPGVSSVAIVGDVAEEISIQFDPQRLDREGISVAQIITAVRSANQNAPFGQLETRGYLYDLRVTGRFNHVGDVAAVPLALANGTVVRLDQIAEVTLAVGESSSESRISTRDEMSASAISLSVVKKTGGNVAAIVDEVHEVIATAQREYLPDNIVIELFADRSDDVRRSINDVTRSGLQTLVIVFLILWLFLGWQEALITSTAIPLTFFMSFIVFEIAGITLNGISMFSLILSLGLLVDNAIVIIEGIHEVPEGASLREHAAQVVQTFKKPLIGGTLTTVAAFFPMLLVSGIIGEFLRTIPIVVASTLLSSLFVALALIPPVAVFGLTVFKKKPRPGWFKTRFDRFANWYSRHLTLLLSRRRRQNAFIGIMVVLLIVGLSLPFIGVLKTSLFPVVDIDFAIVNVELPPGARQEATSATMAKIEAQLAEVAEIESYVANIGSSSSLDLGGGSSSEHLGSFFINLVVDRDRSSIAVTQELRARFTEISGAKITVTDISAGPPTSAPIEIRMVGPDLTRLDELSASIMTELATIDGAIDIERNLKDSAGEFNFTFNGERLAHYGLRAADLSTVLRTSVFGIEATSFLNQAGDEIEVHVEGASAATNSVSAILQLPIIAPSGERIAVGQVAQVELGNSFATIRRRDGERSVSVTAKAATGVTPNEISQEIESRLKAAGAPEGYRYQFGGEQAETVETFNELYRSMFISVVLILLILVVEFNSYRQPLVIFLAVPLALIGVLFGLVLLNTPLSFATFIGLISLVGIVVNDAIILVDRMNHLYAKSNQLFESVLAGAKSRLQPVVLTTLTTAAGVAPLVFVDEFFRDMSITIITGLLFASILTLVFIPMLYLRQQQKMNRRKATRVA